MDHESIPREAPLPSLRMSGLVLDEARELIYGPRAQAYGDAHESFGRIAGLWSALLGTPISPAEVAMCLAALKLSRLATDSRRFDSWADLIGYAALGAELAILAGGPESER